MTCSVTEMYGNAEGELVLVILWWGHFGKGEENGMKMICLHLNATIFLSCQTVHAE